MLIIALHVLWLISSSLAFVSSQCRCVFGQTCWPSIQDFSALASQLSQPLIYPIPTASGCYPLSNPSGNCTDIQDNQFDGNWRSNRPGSMQTPNLESYTFSNGSIGACYVNTSLGIPCTQGSVPVIGVDARSVSDIQAAVEFAVKHNLRLAVKNTGHDYLGRSTARGSFLIWTHHLKNITYNASFVPDGAPSTEIYNAITLGAGVQWHEAYDAAQTQGRILVGPVTDGGSVGAAGGWLMGGGHSPLGPAYGLGVDNVIEFSIVTSAGKYIITNSHKYPDLYWALRGGGGGTYGIVTSVTYRTHPSLPLTGAFFSANSTNNATIKKLLTEFVRIQPDISDAGFGGSARTSANLLQWSYIAPNVSQARANQTLDNFFKFSRNLISEGLNVTFAFTAHFDSFYSWYNQLDLASLDQIGLITELASRLVPRQSVEMDYQAVADVIFNAGHAGWLLVAGGAVSRVDPNSTGLNPAWRKALAHVIYATQWAEGATTTEINQMRNELAGKLASLSNLTPGSGAYFNEGFVSEPNASYAFFGSHYKKLKMIKNIYDPVGLFVVTEGVGSDDWDSNLNCRH